MKGKRIISCILFCIFTFWLLGCSSLKTPAINTLDIKTTDFSKKMKSGESCQTYILGFIGPFGKASVVQAAKNARISKVEVIDYKENYYVLLSQKCICVYGE